MNSSGRERLDQIRRHDGELPDAANVDVRLGNSRDPGLRVGQLELGVGLGAYDAGLDLAVAGGDDHGLKARRDSLGRLQE